MHDGPVAGWWRSAIGTQNTRAISRSSRRSGGRDPPIWNTLAPMIPIPESKREIGIGVRSPTWCASARTSPISSRVSRLAASRRLSSSRFAQPPGKATSPDQGSPGRRARTTKHTLVGIAVTTEYDRDPKRAAPASRPRRAPSRQGSCASVRRSPSRRKDTAARRTGTFMLYLTMFASAFLAATFLPFASELTLAAGLAQAARPTGWSPARHWATPSVQWSTGDSDGSSNTSAIGSGSRSMRSDWNRAGVVPALRGMVAAVRLGPGHRRRIDRGRRHDADPHRPLPATGGARKGNALCRARVRSGRCGYAIAGTRTVHAPDQRSGCNTSAGDRCGLEPLQRNGTSCNMRLPSSHGRLACRPGGVCFRHRLCRSAATRSYRSALRNWSPRRFAPSQSRLYRSGSSSNRLIADSTSAANGVSTSSPLFLVLDQLGNAVRPGGDDGKAALEGFEDGPGVALAPVVAGIHQQVVFTEDPRYFRRVQDAAVGRPGMALEQGEIRVGHAGAEDVEMTILRQVAARLEGFGQPPRTCPSILRLAERRVPVRVRAEGARGASCIRGRRGPGRAHPAPAPRLHCVPLVDLQGSAQALGLKCHDHPPSVEDSAPFHAHLPVA